MVVTVALPVSGSRVGLLLSAPAPTAVTTLVSLASTSVSLFSTLPVGLRPPLPSSFKAAAKAKSSRATGVS
ncbi:hypothetical protein D3C76_862210 [compost metagenome]